MNTSAMDELFGVLRVVKEQQKAVQAALDGLAQERAALEHERAAFARKMAEKLDSIDGATQSIHEAAGSMKGAAREAVPNITYATQKAVEESIHGSLGEVADTAAKALSDATQPVVNRLAGFLESTGQAEAAMKKAGKWFAWKWVMLAAGGFAGLCLMAYIALGYQQLRFEKLQRHKDILEADIAALEANVVKLEKEGGRIQLDQCKVDDRRTRLCVRVSSNQGGEIKEFRGPFRNKAGTASFVVPHGY